jgi:membrane associated rhomboid family serine protease
VLGVWFGLQLLSGTQEMHRGLGGGVAWWAHVGGFVAGLILMPLLSTALGLDQRPRVRHESDEEEDKTGGFW